MIRQQITASSSPPRALAPLQLAPVRADSMDLPVQAPEEEASASASGFRRWQEQRRQQETKKSADPHVAKDQLVFQPYWGPNSRQDAGLVGVSPSKLRVLAMTALCDVRC